MVIGSTISHYKIVEKLGEGGMGVVYKAEDTKLERTVALKFLARHLLDDEEAKQRFLREAKAAAALDHPNICTVYEIGEADAKTFISMAFIEGVTLEDRIAEGPLPIKDALEIARQVADGLQAAHEKSVVHRDIKPANIMVDGKGRATIMDFGLARLTEASRLTKVDTAMGTVAYMSPEQAQGMEVDSGTDIWSLGCVVYEMVSGQRPFLGHYDQALLYEIVHEEVAPLTSVRAGVPMELEFIVGECLAKDRDDRTSSAQDLARKLRTLAEKLKSGRSTILRTAQMTGAVPATVMAGQTLNPAQALPPNSVVMPRSKERALYALAVVLGITVLALGFLYFAGTPEATERLVTRFSFSPESVGRHAVISPDGQHIVYPVGQLDTATLWVRSLDSEAVRELAGTEGVRGAFWSPDSLTIGFGTGAELKRVALNGVNVVTLCELPARRDAGGQFAFRGGSWSPNGQRIVFSAGLLLYEIPAVGGDPKLLFEGDDVGRRFYVGPHFLPSAGDTQAIVYTATAGNPDVMLTVMNLKSGERSEVIPGRGAVYSREGLLLFAPPDDNETGLRALPFSLETLSPSGEAFPINAAGPVASVSDVGTLAYLDGSLRTRDTTLVWRDRNGNLREAIGQPQVLLRWPSLSPDGTRVAVNSNESGNQDVWVHDLTRSTTTRLTFDSRLNVQPTWSPSGREVLYESRADGAARIETKPADGTGEAVALIEADNILANAAWSPDGRYLVYQSDGPSGSPGISLLELRSDGTTSEPIPFLHTAANERVPKVSPNGRLIAYLSNESGRDEVYVRPFPDGAGRWQASVDGGVQPLWSRDGTELFFVDDGAMMAVPVSTEPTLSLGQPQRLFESEDLFSPYVSLTYDVSADGQRFLTVTPYEDDDAPPPAIRVVQNWYEEFRDRE